MYIYMYIFFLSYFSCLFAWHPVRWIGRSNCSNATREATRGGIDFFYGNDEKYRGSLVLQLASWRRLCSRLSRSRELDRSLRTIEQHRLYEVSRLDKFEGRARRDTACVTAMRTVSSRKRWRARHPKTVGVLSSLFFLFFFFFCSLCLFVSSLVHLSLIAIRKERERMRKTGKERNESWETREQNYRIRTFSLRSSIWWTC